MTARWWAYGETTTERLRGHSEITQAMTLFFHRRDRCGVRAARPRRFERMLLRGTFLVIAFAAVCAAVYASSEPSAYQIEAVYLLNFSKFVEWPGHVSQGKDQPFGICILGNDPFGAALDATLSGENIHGASLVARRISKPGDIAGCQILFVSGSEESKLKEIFAALDRTNVLTVSDIPRFSQRGGMIQFVLTGGKVRFEVNLKNASNAGLTLSSALLEVAVAVRKDS